MGRLDGKTSACAILVNIPSYSIGLLSGAFLEINERACFPPVFPTQHVTKRTWFCQPISCEKASRCSFIYLGVWFL